MVNSKTARHLRKAIAQFHSDVPERNLKVVRTKQVPAFNGVNEQGQATYRIVENQTLAHTDCQRALYQAAKRGRVNTRDGVMNPSVSSLFTQ